MFTAAELVTALQRRLRLSSYRTRPGEFPASWQAWFAEQLQHKPERIGAVAGATADAIVGIVLRRELSAPPRATLALNRWQAFNALWRQEWQVPEREERWVRGLAAAVSLFVHLSFALFLLWLSVLHLRMSPPPRGEQVVTQVEFIGEGTREPTGGGPRREPESPAPATPPAEQVAVADSPAPSMPAVQPPTEQTPPAEVPQPEPTAQVQSTQQQQPAPEPPVEQPVVVSKAVPDTGRFVLPSTTRQPPEPKVVIPELDAPALQVPEREIPMADVPEPLPEFRPRPPQTRIAPPVIASEVPEVVEREIPAPQPRLTLPQLPQIAVEAPQLQPEATEVRPARIPTPPAPSESVPEPEPSPPVAATPSLPATPDAASQSPVEPAPAEPQPSPAADPIVGAGPETDVAPGAWPTPAVADDWGDAAQAQPGDQAGEPAGLFDSDGSVNLADTPGSASPGLPPGTITQEIADLDRAGTWLRRAPNDFRPSAFARYWRPNESLLEEWVRKSVTTVRIPIPGTNKSLVCETVLLAVGGGCWVHDPNLNNQPPTARPPPDIPFKPELQKSDGIAPPGG